jgi:hypothetical protein
VKRFLLIAAIVLLPTTWILAGARHFTFLYEAPTSAPGSLELENSVTWKHISDPESANEIEIRHEFEIGITDHFQASLYLPDWSYQKSAGQSELAFSDFALEFIYNLSNPIIHPVGISLYQEYKVGPQLIEWESKFIAQKNIWRWILAYNLTLEAVWEGQTLEERQGELSQAFGASYEISPRLSVGLEMLHEMVFPNWRDRGKIRNFFVGPNVAYRHHDWFVTVSALAQATDTPDEAVLQVRTIFGFAF